MRADDTNATTSLSLGENPGNAVPPQKIVELKRPVPVTSRRKLKPPADAVLGDRELMTGEPDGLGMLNTKAAEVPPPGAGLRTVISAVPPESKGEN